LFLFAGFDPAANAQAVVICLPPSDSRQKDDESAPQQPPKAMQDRRQSAFRQTTGTAAGAENPHFSPEPVAALPRQTSNSRLVKEI
jgi:hypothetical protein